jgi:hypothetical protein
MHDYDLVARSSAALLMPSITADRQVQISSCTTAMPTGAGCAELAAVSVEIDAECCCNTKQMVLDTKMFVRITYCEWLPTSLQGN